MKAILRSGFLALALLLPGVAVAKEQWLCIATLSTGFAYRDGEWKTTQFKVDDDKFIFTRERDERIKDIDESYWPSGYWNYSIVELGSDFRWGCDPSRLMVKENNFIGTICASFGNLHLSLDTMRYMRSSMWGYTVGDKPDSTPNITIGACAPL